MAGTSPAMTPEEWFNMIETRSRRRAVSRRLVRVAGIGGPSRGDME
jgi:hypothetical protein